MSNESEFARFAADLERDIAVHKPERDRHYEELRKYADEHAQTVADEIRGMLERYTGSSNVAVEPDSEDFGSPHRRRFSVETYSHEGGVFIAVDVEFRTKRLGNSAAMSYEIDAMSYVYRSDENVLVKKEVQLRRGQGGIHHVSEAALQRNIREQYAELRTREQE